MFGGELTINRCSKGTITFTIYHPDGDFLGISLTLEEARVILDKLKRSVDKKDFNRDRPKIGRKAKVHVYNGEGRTKDQWADNLHMSRGNFDYHVRTKGSVATAIDHILRSRKNGSTREQRVKR